MAPDVTQLNSKFSFDAGMAAAGGGCVAGTRSGAQRGGSFLASAAVGAGSARSAGLIPSAITAASKTSGACGGLFKDFRHLLLGSSRKKKKKKEKKGRAS